MKPAIYNMFDTPKINHLWHIYYQETKALLDNCVVAWMREEKRDLLKNFFHSRQGGGKSFAMINWLNICEKMEQYLQNGGDIASMIPQTAQIRGIFEQDAQQVIIALKGE